MEPLLRSTLLPLTTMLTIMKLPLLNTKPPLLTTPKRSSPPMRPRPRLPLVFTMLLLLMRPFFLLPFPHAKVKNVKLVALMVAVAAMDVAITPEDEVVGADKEEGNEAVDKVADKAAE